ncbi:glycosyltransferase [Candidatus Uhrbacteria bacterium]|nr:glycosyltransferase [Candidatus Uhrbacteria bacterium]
MRFLLASSDLPPRRGGVARYHTAVVQALGEDGAVHHVRFDHPASFGAGHRHWLRLLWELPAALRRHRASTLIIGEILPIGTVAWVLRTVLGTPYVVVCHGLDLRNALRVPRRRWLACRILRRAQLVIANSAHTEATARLLGADPSRLHVIPPPIGITPALTQPAQTPDVRRAHHLEHSRMVLSVGRLVARKGFDTLIQAMTIVQRTHPRATLVVVGDGPERQALEALARTERVSIRFLGALDDAETAAWYAACDVFALLPRELTDGDVEGFGIVYLEAGAFGKPVIGTRSGGVPEAVIGGETGVLIPPDDPAAAAGAITLLLRDREIAERFGHAGAQRAATEFSRERFNERLHRALVHPSRPFSFSHEKEKGTKPRIAVVVPVWNDRGSLRRCLTALAGQTFSDIEVVVIDDGSTPPVELRVKSDEVRVRLIRQEHAGAPAARNRGARETESELIMFCDADIELIPNALERMVRTLDAHPEASYAYSAFRFGWKLFRSFPFDAGLLRRMPHIHTTALTRRAHFPGFDESLTRFQDWDLWLTMLERGHVGIHIPEVLFTIRNTRGTMSRWVPSFMHRLPWRSRRVREYDAAAEIVQRKHQLPGRLTG